MEAEDAGDEIGFDGLVCGMLCVMKSSKVRTFARLEVPLYG